MGEGRSFYANLVRKLQLLLRSVFTFLLLSSLIGFFVRVVVTSFSLLAFPLALLAEGWGLRLSDAPLRALMRSFPWIGVQVEVLRRAGRPVGPMLKAQLLFLAFQYFSYISCKLAW